MHPIIEFARVKLGVDLYDGQKACVNEYYTSMQSNWLLLAGRRSGKSLISDLIAVYEAVVPTFENMTRQNEERYILLVSVRQDSAQVHIRNIERLLKHSKELGSMIVKVAEDRIILANGCVILSLPASARAARGYTASTLILDEAAFFVDTLGNSSAESIFTALEPTVATFGEMARIVITTSVGAKTGLVYDLYDRSTQGDLPGWYVTRVPTQEMNPKVSAKTIESALKRDAEGAEAEYFCEWRERTEAFFNSEALARCVDRGLHLFERKKKADHYLMAVDPALMKDRYGFAIAHLEDGVVVIDYVKALHPPVDALGAEDLLASLVERYKPTGVLCDNASTSQRLKGKIPAMKYTPFTRPMKLKIYGALKEAINLEQVVLPNDGELLDELKALQIRNGVDIAAPKSGRVTHDDLADCVALLVDGLVSGNYELQTAYVMPDPWKVSDEEMDEWRRSKLPHPEGVDHTNCKNRKRNTVYGCEACRSELEATPEGQARLAADEAMKNTVPMSDEDAEAEWRNRTGYIKPTQEQIQAKQAVYNLIKNTRDEVRKGAGYGSTK